MPLRHLVDHAGAALVSAEDFYNIVKVDHREHLEVVNAALDESQGMLLGNAKLLGESAGSFLDALFEDLVRRFVLRDLHVPADQA